MNQGTQERTAFEALDKEYRAYVGQVRAEWLARNRSNSRDVYEVMRPQERAEVHHRIDQWGRYITPLAEAWWKKRGYGVVWPDNDSKPMQVYKLEVA